MLEHYIGDTARGKVLKELTNRLQKQVADIMSPWYALDTSSQIFGALKLRVLGITSLWSRQRFDLV